jgi:hypothetical protein
MREEASSRTTPSPAKIVVPTLAIVRDASVKPRWKQRHRRTRFQRRSCVRDRRRQGGVAQDLLLLHPIEHQDISVRFALGVSSFDDMRHSLPVLRHGPRSSRGDTAVNFVCDVNLHQYVMSQTSEIRIPRSGSI